MKWFHINVYVNNECNRSCPHCYYPHGDLKMSLNMADYVARWVSDLYAHERVERFKTHFLGGEPFLNLEAVLSIIDTVSLTKPSYTKSSPEGGYLVFTNGDYLTTKSLESLKKRKARLMLNPTYDDLPTVEEKMKLIKSVCGGVSLAITLTNEGKNGVESNMDRLPELTQLVVKYDAHMRVNRLYHGGKIPGYAEMYKKQMKKALEILLEAEKPIWPNFIVETSYVLSKSNMNPYCCGKWLLIIDPDGTIRSCNADFETKVGHIFTHKKMLDIKLINKWSAENLPKCQKCKWVTWCQGGCPYTRKLAYGTYDKKSPFCDAFKELFPIVMKLVERYKNEAKDKYDIFYWEEPPE